jgi:hypothetical protein
VGSVTPVVVPGEGYVRVEVNWADFPHTRKCWIYRRVAGVLTMLREGNAVPLSGGLAVAFDHEMPYDVPVGYRSVIALNANGDFEDGVTEWLDTTNNGTVGTVTQSKAYYVPGEGIASALLKPNGSSTAQAVSEFIPATAGTSYTITGRIMLSDYWAGGTGVRIHWFNGTTLLSTVGAYNDTAPVPGEFGTYGFAATAPATTTQMRIMFGAAGTPPTTLRLYGDEVYVTTSGTGVNAAADVTVPSDGAGWWVDPLHPATKVKLRTDLQASACVPDSAIGLLGMSPETFPADEESLPINNSVTPYGAWQVRKGGQATMQVVTVTLTDLAQLKSLHASGAPLLLQLPTQYGEEAAYQLHAELEVSRLGSDMRRPWRVTRSSFVKVLPPVGPPEGTYRTRYMDFTKLTTFQDTEALGGGGYDRYTRSVSNGWGTSTSGLVTTTLGGAASVYSVNGSQGVIAVDALSANRMVLYPVSLFQFGIRARMIGFTPTGGNPETYLYARYVDASNYVRAAIYRQAAGGMTARVSQVIGGIETASGFLTVAGAANNSTVRMDFQGVGTNLYLTVWVDGTTKPQAYTVTLGSLTMLSAGQVGIAINFPVTVTNVLPFTTAYDDLEITALSFAPTWLDGLQGELMAP